MKLSIILPFYNKEPWIGRTLWTYQQQTLPKDLWEIIVIDACSSRDDLIRSIVTEASKHLDIRLFRVSGSGTNLSRNYNIGIKKAHGDIIALSDPEIMLYPWVLGKLYYPHLENDKVFSQPGFLYLLTGEEQCLLDTVNWQENLDNIFKLRGEKPLERITGNIRMISVRKQWFETIGGFDEDFEFIGHQDDDIYHRLRNNCFDDYPDKGLHLKPVGPSLSLEPHMPARIACFHQCHGGPMNIDFEKQKEMKQLLESRRNKLMRNEGKGWGVL